MLFKFHIFLYLAILSSYLVSAQGDIAPVSANFTAEPAIDPRMRVKTLPGNWSIIERYMKELNPP